MSKRLRELVRRRAGDRCEYCHLPQQATPFVSFHVEHIIAKQHVSAATKDPQYLALSCDRCNAHKGPNLTSIDPDSGQISVLFDPRKHTWDEHFEVCEGIVAGKTGIGRATVRLLNMNAPRRVELRLEWLQGTGDK
ncbi:HNH endonuclease [Symmachiella dynata]|uniref:HNH endonuclease n=1 Tax=Symmachiella dynata TaxID=2527995 RepID=UPI0030EDE046